MDLMSKSTGELERGGDPRPEVSFEEAIKQLELIVEGMESDELPLEAMLGKFEEGAKLARFCQQKLTEAEVRVKTLEKTVEGNFEMRAMELAQDPSED